MFRVLLVIVISLIAGNSYACKLARTIVDFKVTYQASALPQVPNFKIVKLRRGAKPTSIRRTSCSGLEKLGVITFRRPINARKNQGYLFEVVEGNIGDNSLFGKNPVRLLNNNKDKFVFRWSDYPTYFRKPIHAKIKIIGISLSGRKSAPQYIYIKPASEKPRSHFSSVAHAHNGRVHSHVLPRAGMKHRHGNSAYGTSTKRSYQSKIRRLSTQTNFVSHSHNGRIHSHILPRVGIKHRHGSSAYGASTKRPHQSKIRHSSTTRTNFSPHSHNGRIHSHPLPRAGFAHKHGNSAYAIPLKRRQKTGVRNINRARFVAHSHANRVHSHALPKVGIRHAHGRSAIGQAVRGRQAVATTKNYIPTYISTTGPAIHARGNLFLVKNISYGNWKELHPPIVVANYKIKPNNQALKKFRATLDRLNVWSWKKRYYSPRTEGWKDNITITYPDKKVTVNMVSKNPEGYNEFMDALLELVQYEQHVISRNEFMRKLQALPKKR